MSGARFPSQGLPFRRFACWQRRRVTALLGLMLMAFNLWGAAVLPSALLPKAMAYDSVTVCTGSGMVDIPLDDGGKSLPVKHDAGGLCAFCLPVMNGGLGEAADGPAPLPPLGFPVPGRQAGGERSMLPAGGHDCAHAPRAPPAHRA
jgi:hypothetical protein